MNLTIKEIIGPNTVLAESGKELFRVRVPVNKFRPLKVGAEIEVEDSEAKKVEPAKAEAKAKKVEPAKAEATGVKVTESGPVTAAGGEVPHAGEPRKK